MNQLVSTHIGDQQPSVVLLALEHSRSKDCEVYFRGLDGGHLSDNEVLTTPLPYVIK